MMNSRWTAFWLALNFVALVAVLSAVANTHGTTSAVSAAWLQAIGSIAAIVAAAWISNGQAEAARQREERQRSDALRRDRALLNSQREAGQAIMAITLAHVITTRKNLEPGGRGISRYSVDNLAAILEKLAVFPAGSLAMPILAGYFSCLEGVFRICVRSITEAQEMKASKKMPEAAIYAGLSGVLDQSIVDMQDYYDCFIRDMKIEL